MLAVAAALLPQAASAHAQLLESDPPASSLLQSAPAFVTLVFSERVTPAGAGIKVFSPTGRQVAAAVTTNGAALSTRVDAKESGTYVVVWQVFAADTHPSRGAFAFSVEKTSDNPYAALLSAPEVGTATPLGLVLQSLAHVVHFIGFALAFGVAGYRMLSSRGQTFARIVGTGVALLVAAEPLSLVAQLASLSFDPDTALAVLGSTFGRIFGLRLAAALLAWTLLPTGRSWPLLAIGAADAVLDGAGAHAVAGVPGGQLLVAAHVAAMGMWVGGLVAFTRAPDPRLARYAALAFGIAAAFGLVLALAHTRFGASLVTTDYGRWLLAKAAVVGVALVMAIARRRRPELVAAMLAVAAATVVAALPPPY